MREKLYDELYHEFMNSSEFAIAYIRWLETQLIEERNKTK